MIKLTEKLRGGACKNRSAIKLGGMLHYTSCLEAADRIEALEAELLAAQHGYLPVITDDLAEAYNSENFIELEDGKWVWTQAAVDFACLTSKALNPEQE